MNKGSFKELLDIFKEHNIKLIQKEVSEGDTRLYLKDDNGFLSIHGIYGSDTKYTAEIVLGTFNIKASAHTLNFEDLYHDLLSMTKSLKEFYENTYYSDVIEYLKEIIVEE